MDLTKKNPMMTSDSGEWETPQELFNELNEIFGFTLDVCATEGNAKIPGSFISPEQDAFKVPWNSPVCWNNPPYGRSIGKWITRSREQSEKQENTVVVLIPARVETKWFQEIFSYASLICFVRGRLKFTIPNGDDNSAPFPSAIVVFSSGDLDDSTYESMTAFGNVIDPREGAILVYNNANG